MDAPQKHYVDAYVWCSYNRVELGGTLLQRQLDARANWTAAKVTQKVDNNSTAQSLFETEHPNQKEFIIEFCKMSEDSKLYLRIIK